MQSLDVKFNPRDGLYYRIEEPLGEVNAGGIEVVDYGYRGSSKRNPAIVGRLEAGPTHNLCVHPDVPIVYAVNTFVDEERLGLEIWNVENPTNPKKIRGVWSKNGFHDAVFDPAVSISTMRPAKVTGCSMRATPLDQHRWDGFPTTANRSTPPWARWGFESGHYADFDPRRELAVVGDELTTGVPGGKHVFDIGWRNGTPKNPIPVGFTHSPNAQPHDPETDNTMWTTHNHDVVPYGERTLLVSGDYSEGVVLYDITDPTNLHAIDRHPTTAKSETVSGGERAPRAWSATYNRARDVVFASDIITGAYTLRIG